MKKLYPLTFQPIYQEYFWGGSRIRERFHRPLAPLCIAESWEIADRVEGMSRVVNGSLEGYTLQRLVAEFGEIILGRNQKDSRFPLLVKMIDAKESLSIQVHPNNESAAKLQSEPKTEMWYFIEGGPVFAGLNRPVSRCEWIQAVNEGSIEHLIRKFDVNKGEAVFVPGGQIHAIGPGCLILEIQQNSNTTYRVHDWSRADQNGIQRPLHIAEAFECIHWNDHYDPVVRPEVIEESAFFKRLRIHTCPFFSVEKLEIADQYAILADPDTFQIIFHLSGERQGMSELIPAVSDALEIKGPATILRIYR